MAQVLVLDSDHDVRAALAAALELEGHRVVIASDVARCLALLQESAASLIAVCGNQDAANSGLRRFFAEVAAQAPLAARHRYIYLTTTPEAIPADLLASLLQLAAPILAKPFALDDLLVAVQQMATCPLHVARVPVRKPPTR